MKLFSCLLGLLLSILLSACGGGSGGGVVTSSALSYGNTAPVYTVGAPISANSPSSSGGAVTSYAVNPALPTGLSLNSSSGVIAGTSTAASAATSYTVTASKAGASATATIWSRTQFPPYNLRRPTRACCATGRGRAERAGHGQRNTQPLART